MSEANPEPVELMKQELDDNKLHQVIDALLQRVATDQQIVFPVHIVAMDAEMTVGIFKSTKKSGGHFLIETLAARQEKIFSPPMYTVLFWEGMEKPLISYTGMTDVHGNMFWPLAQSANAGK